MNARTEAQRVRRQNELLVKMGLKPIDKKAEEHRKRVFWMAMAEHDAWMERAQRELDRRRSS